MQATTVGIGWIEVLLFFLSGGGWLGLPPGERDVVLVKAAPQQSLVYLEWAGRGPGKPGGTGIDGFVADPEIQAFFGALATSFGSGVDSGEDPNSAVRREALQWLKQLTANPGCIYATFDAPPPGNGLLRPATPAEILGRLHIGVISDAGRDAATILDGFNRIVGGKVSVQPQMEQVTISIGKILTVHRDGDRLLFGFGRGVVERSLAGLRGTLPGLDSNPRFAEASKRVTSPRFGSVGWLDLRGAVNASLSSLGAAGMLFQAVVRGSGADAFDSVISATGVVDGTVIQRTFIATGGRNDGVLQLTGSPAIRIEQLRHIPADSDLVAAISLDIAQLVGSARDLISKTTPLSAAVFDEAIKELETELKLTLAAEVFPAFGNAWTAFNSPSEGGIAGTSLIIALEVRDPQKAQVVFDRLMQLLEQSLAADSDPDHGGAYAEMKRHEFLNHSIRYVSYKPLSVGVKPSATPSFCLTRNHMLISLHPQSMKAHLRYLASGRPGFDNVAARKLSLANQDLLVATYLDGPRATELFSGFAPFLAQVLTGSIENGGQDFDTFLIPSAAALLPYAGDLTLSLARQKDGILLESRNPQTATAMLTVLMSARSWIHAEYDQYMETQAKSNQPANQAGLGAAEGAVVPAAAAQPANPKLQEKPASVVTRKLAPLMIKAFVPDGAQQFIPDDVFRNLGRPPSPEVLQQREDRRRLQEERRRERLEQRRAPAPTRPRVPNPPAPNPPPPVPNP